MKKLNFCQLNYQYRNFCKISNIKRKYPIDREKEKSLPIYDYSTKNPLNKKVYVWGQGETGALGLVVPNEFLRVESSSWCVKYPKRSTFAEYHPVTNISCGYNFTAFAVEDNKNGKILYGSGVNSDSQIGQHKFGKKFLEYILIPQPIQLPLSDTNSKIIDISAGRAHLLVLTDNDGLFTLGNNSFGQCGRKIIQNEDYFVNNFINHIQRLDDERIVKVCAGMDHSLAITENGKLYSCGWSADGQTGLGHFNNQEIFFRVKGDLENEKIVKVSTVCDCNLALNDKGQIFGWGNTEYHQIPLPKEIQQVNIPRYLDIVSKICGKIVDIACGGTFCLVLNDQNDVYVWGFGILGKGPIADYAKEPTLIPSTLFGRNEHNTDCKITKIYCGLNCMGAISDGNLYVWGKNSHGKLGLGHENDQYFPFKVALNGIVQNVHFGIEHSIAICKSFL